MHWSLQTRDVNFTRLIRGFSLAIVEYSMIYLKLQVFYKSNDATATNISYFKLKNI